MEAKLVYVVMEFPATPEDRAKHGWGDHVTSVHWLCHLTNVYVDGFLVTQTNPVKVAYFNFDSDARLFQTYLGELEDKVRKTDAKPV